MKKLIFLFLMFPFIVFGATDYSQDANNVGFFPMEDVGTETDEGGNTSNNLTENSGTIPRTSGSYFAGSYSRDFERGDTEDLEHADSLDTDLNGADQNISIVCWFDRESSSGVIEALVSKNRINGSNRQYTFNVNGGGNPDYLQFTLNPDGVNGTICRGATTILSGTPVHGAGVYNDTDIRVYHNGSLDTQANNPKTYSSGLYNGTGEFKIGSYEDSSSVPYRHFDGEIDDVAIFDRALTSVEVSDIYSNSVDGSNEVVGRRRVMIVMKSLNSPTSKYIRDRLDVKLKPEIMVVKVDSGKDRYVIFRDSAK